MTAWDDAVRIHAGTRNLELRSPLRAPEVSRLAMSISCVWNGGGPAGRGRGWTQEQRSRGGQTWGRMRRFDRLPRDSAIVKAVNFPSPSINVGLSRTAHAGTQRLIFDICV